MKNKIPRGKPEKALPARKVKLGPTLRPSRAKAVQKLAELKAKMTDYHKAFVAKGGKLTKYWCGHHSGLIETRQPKPEQVSGKGYWDSATECTECSGMSFVSVWPNGKTESKIMPLGKLGQAVELTPAEEKKVWLYNPGHKGVKIEIR